MSEFTLVRKKITLKDEDDNVILQAPLLDLYYTITNSFIGNEGNSIRQNMAIAAKSLNDEWGTDFSWGEVSDLLEELHVKMEELKKKRTSMQESLSGTE